MFIPKRYGQSKTNKCPFCNRDAFFQNNQKIPTCKEHKNNTLDNLKCVCGSWLDIREGKYGVFFSCINCGALNLRKVVEINSLKENTNIHKLQKKENNTKEENVESKEITIRSDELDFF